jgi:TPR repeat protein
MALIECITYLYHHPITQVSIYLLSTFKYINNISKFNRIKIRITMDQIESAQQYSSAAELGDVNAQFTLALMYANGLGGLTKDFIYAHKWATMSAMNGNTEAAMLAELLAQQMTHQETESSRKLILQYRNNKL